MNIKKIHGNINFDNDCYFQIFKSGRTNMFTVVEMQHFDETGYDQNRFVRNSDGDIHCFEKEHDAIKKLNEWFKPDEIDPEYLITDNDTYIIRD